jgi:hypothetical protein
MMGNTVKSRVLIIHDGKYSQSALSITQISCYPGKSEIEVNSYICDEVMKGFDYTDISQCNYINCIALVK